MSVDVGPFQDIVSVGWGGNDIIFLTLAYQNPWRFQSTFTDGFVFFGIRFPDNPELNMGQFSDNQGTLYDPSQNIPAWSGYDPGPLSGLGGFTYYLGPTDEIFAGVSFHEQLDDGNFSFAAFFRVPFLPASEGQIRMQIFAAAPFAPSAGDPIISQIPGTIRMEVARRMTELPTPFAELVDSEAQDADFDLVFRWAGGGDLRSLLGTASMPLGSDVLISVPLFQLEESLPAIRDGGGVLVAEVVYNRGSRTAELIPEDTGAGPVDPWGDPEEEENP